MINPTVDDIGREVYWYDRVVYAFPGKIHSFDSVNVYVTWPSGASWHSRQKLEWADGLPDTIPDLFE